MLELPPCAAVKNAPLEQQIKATGIKKYVPWINNFMQANTTILK